MAGYRLVRGRGGRGASLYLEEAPEVPSNTILVPKGTRFYLSGGMADPCLGCVQRQMYNLCYVDIWGCSVKRAYNCFDVPAVPYKDLEGFQGSEKTVNGDTLLFFLPGASFVIHGQWTDVIEVDRLE